MNFKAIAHLLPENLRKIVSEDYRLVEDDFNKAAENIRVSGTYVSDSGRIFFVVVDNKMTRRYVGTEDNEEIAVTAYEPKSGEVHLIGSSDMTHVLEAGSTYLEFEKMIWRNFLADGGKL